MMDGSRGSTAVRDSVVERDGPERARDAAHRPGIALAGGYGRPLHIYPAAVTIGAFVAAVAFDVASKLGEGRAFGRPATWLVAIGIVSGVVAAIVGLFDFGRITKGTRARQVATLHLILMDLVLVLFIVSFLLRRSDDLQYLDGTPMVALVLSAVGLVLMLVGAWFGSSLVSTFGVRVVDDVDQLPGYALSADAGAQGSGGGSDEDVDGD